ncbi:hypothetical protein AX14_005543, partial [Amanita brunnescens Koide BX004]
MSSNGLNLQTARVRSKTSTGLGRGRCCISCRGQGKRHRAGGKAKGIIRFFPFDHHLRPAFPRSCCTFSGHPPLHRRRSSASRVAMPPKKVSFKAPVDTSAKRELESAMSVISTMKVQQDAERKVYESRIQRLKARTPMESKEPATEDSALRKELAVAKERIAFLEKAYKQKSEALKAAEAVAQKPKEQPKRAANKGPELPKWGFEPPENLPNSQPYWDYRNAYSDHIAAMVAATVSAIPHIPLSSAISSAISTVSKAGPPPELAQKAKGKRPSGSSRPTSPAPSRPARLPTSPSPPVIPKPSPPPVLAHSSLTMAQI